MTQTNLFLVKVEYYNEYKGKEEYVHAIYNGDNFIDVMEQITEEWNGDKDIINVDIYHLEEHCSLDISASLYKALKHDLSTNIKAIESNWHEKMVKKGEVPPVGIEKRKGVCNVYR